MTSPGTRRIQAGQPPKDWVDFHLHSNFSDGSDAPLRVVERAVAAGMCGLALTDHDSVRGLAEAATAAAAAGVGFVRGVEVSAGQSGVEVHVVGLGVDPENGALRGTLDGLSRGRTSRFLDMASSLERAGIPVLAFAEDTVRRGLPCGRMNLAARLCEMGVTRTVQEGFDRFLKPGGAGYVPKSRVPVPEAIGVIHAAGGLAFVAHPGLGKGLLRMLPDLLRHPFDGIEAYHVSHSPQRVGELLVLAEERGLLVSGGSDCHGTIKGHAPEMGRVRVPLTAVSPLLERLDATFPGLPIQPV